MLTLRKTIPRGGYFPRLYGFSHYDWPSRAVVCYPVPLNMVVSWARRTWLGLRHNEKGHDDPTCQAYWAGYIDGDRDARETFLQTR